MDVEQARTVLGLRPGDGWEAVRPAYRRLIQELHPDRAGVRSTGRAAQVNEAYAVLIRAKRAEAAAREGQTAGMAPSAGASQRRRRTSSTSSRQPQGAGAEEDAPSVTQFDGTDVVFLDMPAGEALVRLLAAGDLVGDISYVDRSSGIFEVIVRHDEETWSLLVTLRRRGRGTEALFTMEALQRVASPSPTPVVRQLVDALRRHTS